MRGSAKMVKGDKDHGGYRGCSKKKFQSRGLKKKSKEEKESSPFNVFMKAELARLKQVLCVLACLVCLSV